MCKSRIIVSAHVEGNTPDQNVAAHARLLERLCKRNTLSHAIGHFDGKEELSVVIDLEPRPFLVLAVTAHDLARKFNQQSVYFSKDGKAFLMSKDGELTVLGNECEGDDLAWCSATTDNRDRTKLVGVRHYIWTEPEK